MTGRSRAAACENYARSKNFRQRSSAAGSGFGKSERETSACGKKVDLAFGVALKGKNDDDESAWFRYSVKCRDAKIDVARWPREFQLVSALAGRRDSQRKSLSCMAVRMGWVPR